MTAKMLKNAFWTVTVILVFALSARFSGVDVGLFISRRGHLTDIVSAMFPPAWSYAAKIVSPLLATVQMSVTGTVAGSVLALLLSPLCASNLGRNKALSIVLRVLIQILRSFPALILALMATFIFGLGTFAGTFAITLYTCAIIARLTYEDIESASLRAYFALLSMGCSSGKAFFRAVFPQISSSYLTNVLYLLETNVRHSAILGYVGAGGIGLILNEKVSWREYDKVGMILCMLFIAVCFIEWLSTFLSSVVRGERRLSENGRKALWVSVFLLFAVCTVTIAPPDFTHTSVAIVKNMFMGFIRPDWAFFLDISSSGLAYLLLETVSISVVGTIIGALLAAPLAFLGTSRFNFRPLAAVFRVLIAAIRSVPFLIYGLIFIRVCGPGAFTGALTLAVCSVGLLCKRFTETIEALDLSAYYALEAMGVSALLRIRYAIIPQISAAFYSAVLYRFDVNIREAAILGLVGAGGIGAPLIFSMNHFDWHTAGAIVLGLIILVWFVDIFSVKLRKKL